MFEHYAFSAKRKFGDVHYVKNEKFIELSLDELMSHLKEVSAFFCDNLFNIELAKLFINIDKVKKITIDTISENGSICTPDSLACLLEFIRVFPEKIEIEIIEPAESNSEIGLALDRTFLTNVAKVIASDRSLTKLVKNSFGIKPLPISIYGSCCSRDIFDAHDKYNKKSLFTISKYISNNSIVSIFSAPFYYDELDINLDSKFLQYAVKADLDKTTLIDFIHSLSPESLCIIDIMDERFDLLSYRGSYITKTWNFVKTNSYKKIKSNCSQIDFDSEEKIKQTCDNISRLLEIIKSNISYKKIVINNTPMAEYYYSDEGFKRFDDQKYNVLRYNNFHQRVITYIKENHSDVIVMETPWYLNFGDTNHKWGVHPYHFNKSFYLSRAKRLLLAGVSL